ncbi:hypothetical protein [Cruoricaptor ignavus]|uniref:hypothetical protein n=1 Tax=Cruoricaptor ignavus TaxID=1118202 RepID=UPI001D0BEBF4|nr:hypothetical protein [Cruoricaptor ignavus]
MKQEIESASQELPAQHFSDTDLQNEWAVFLSELKTEDVVIFSAIQNFRLSKKDEETIEVLYPSEAARSEFEKVQNRFFNHFKTKVNNQKIKTEFRMEAALRKEVVTTRKKFEKFAEINPLLKDLHELMQFDLS